MRGNVRQYTETGPMGRGKELYLVLSRNSLFLLDLRGRLTNNLVQRIHFLIFFYFYFFIAIDIQKNSQYIILYEL